MQHVLRNGYLNVSKSHKLGDEIMYMYIGQVCRIPTFRGVVAIQGFLKYCHEWRCNQERHW